MRHRDGGDCKGQRRQIPAAIVLIAAVGLALTSVAAGARTSDTPHLIGYFTNWAQYRPGACKFFPENIDDALASKLSHVHYAFAKLNAAGDVMAIEWDDCPTGAWPGCQGTAGSTMYERMMALRAKHGHLKVVLSIGGWTWGSTNTCPIFSAMASDATSRANFVKQSVTFARTFGFDGISIDWEYPGFVPRDCKASDTANFKALMQELRAASDAEAAARTDDAAALTIAAAVPAGLPEIADEKPADVVPYVDYLQLMSYDYHGAWENFTGVNTPLVEEMAGDGMSITTTLEAYKAQGVDTSKIVLGFATYGRSWDVSGDACVASGTCTIGTPAPKGGGTAGSCTRQAGVLAYYEILDIVKAAGTKVTYNATLEAPYAVAASGNPFVGYDDVQSITAKAQLVGKYGLAGAMAWSLDTDDFNNGYPLMSALAAVLEGSGCPQGCSNHGVCLRGNTCACDPGWSGADCSTCTCGSADGEVCSGHGTCHFNSTADSCSCQCSGGWLGANCDTPNVPSSCKDAGTAITPVKGYFSAVVHVTSASALQGWLVSWDFTGDAVMSTCWGAPEAVTATNNGTHVTVQPSTVVDVPAGGAIGFTCGANAANPGSPPKAVFLNGVACD